MHGGHPHAGRNLRYEAECPDEQGLMLIIERFWDVNCKGNPESHIPIECPICGNEHLLAKSADLPA